MASSATTSAWDTPPKKSVSNVLSRGRLNRSERTPGVDLIICGSYIPNCGSSSTSAVLSWGERAFETHEILHSRLTGLVDLFEVFEHVVRISVNYGNPKVPVVFVLVMGGSAPVRIPSSPPPTEYEFSANCDDPVARMFGE